MASAENFTSKFLRDIELSQYESKFLSEGFETFIDLLLIEGQDLNVLQVCERDHQDRILKAVDGLSVDMLLEAYHLECYIKEFHLHNIKSIKDLKSTKIDDTLLEKLRIRAPGHRKRFNLCVQLLQSKSEKEPEQPQERQHLEEQQELLPQAPIDITATWHPDAVAIGYWSRPTVLKKLSNDFLCVKGFLKAGPEDSSHSDCLEFLVDSASDVVTAREELITKMNFTFLKNVDSHGVHSVKEKPLYRAYLRLGKSDWMSVEVQPEEYESVGSTVMKMFFHFINGNFHQWIPNVQHS